MNAAAAGGKAGAAGRSPALPILLGVLLTALLFGLPTPDRGLWDRGYLANLPMPTRAAWEGSFHGTGHPPGQDFPPVTPESPAGIGAYLDTGCSRPHVPRALEALEELGLTWARTEIPWAGVEPMPGHWEWERWDRVVDGLHARRYRVLGMLCYWTGGVEPYSDTAIERFGRYAEAVARRYRGRVDHWEVWNEPNSPTYWTAGPERYVQLLKAAYLGVKRGNPQATVIGGSLSGVDLVYLRKMLDAGAAQWMDALSVHPYFFGWAPESTRLLQELRGAAAVMHSAGKSPGLWVTEIGTTTWKDPKAAEWLERAVILTSQSRAVDAWFWFTLYLTDASAYALYRTDWSPRPSAHAYRSLVRRLEGARPVGSALPGELTPPWGSGHPAAWSPPQIWGFRKGRQTLLAAWSGEGNVVLSPEVTGPMPRTTLTSTPQWWDRGPESVTGPSVTGASVTGPSVGGRDADGE